MTNLDALRARRPGNRARIDEVRAGMEQEAEAYQLWADPSSNLQAPCSSSSFTWPVPSPWGLQPTTRKGVFMQVRGGFWEILV